MRAPLSWIREFTPVDAPVADLVSALNQLGLEVEGVEQPGEEVTGVIAAQVLEVVPHPTSNNDQRPALQSVHLEIRVLYQFCSMTDQTKWVALSSAGGNYQACPANPTP